MDGATQEELQALRDRVAALERENEALRQHKRAVRRALEAAADVMMIVGRDGRFTGASDSLTALLGWERDEVIGRVPTDFAHPDDAGVGRASIEAAIHSPASIKGGPLVRVRHKDGHWLVFDSLFTDMRHDPEFDGVVMWCRDVTARVRAEQEHADMLAQLNEAQRIAELGSFAFDPHTLTVQGSEQLHRIFGLDPATGPFPQLDQVMTEFVHPKDREILQRSLSSMQGGGDADPRVEFRITRSDGTVRHLISEGVFARGRMVGLVRDVTERVRARETLERRSAELRRAQRLAQLGSWTVDVATGVVTCSEEVHRIFGMEGSPLAFEYTALVAALGSRIHPDDLGRITASFGGQRPSDPPPTEVDYRVIMPDGTIKHVAILSVPELGEDGALHSISGIAQDITQRKGFERALREREELLEAAQRVAKVGSWSYDPCTGEVEWSDELYRMFGFPVRRDPQPTALEVLETRIHPGDQALARARVRSVRDERSMPGFEYRVILPGGELRHVQAAPSQRITDEAGSTLRVVGTVQDITERKRQEHEREALIAELADKNAELERFAYSVSHDLKSPLVTIHGFLGFLERDLASDDATRVTEDIAAIRKAADAMRRLLDELLALSRVGRSIGESVPLPLDEVVAEVADRVAGRLADGAVELEVRPSLPIAFGDRDRVAAVFQNLIDNAVKFTADRQDARVTVAAEPVDDGARVKCWIRDNGIGIDPRHHGRIFGLFERVGQRGEGSGIGLALARRIVEVHGGAIWVESAGLGTGSTFYFTLPAAPPPRLAPE